MTESEGRTRRRRRRATAAQGAPAPGSDPSPQSTPASSSPETPTAIRATATTPAAEAPLPKRRRGGERGSRDPSEGGLRDIVGGGSSQLGVEGALRARDVNRPTERDLADAERDIVVVRRHWTPSAKH